VANPLSFPTETNTEGLDVLVGNVEAGDSMNDGTPVKFLVFIDTLTTFTI